MVQKKFVADFLIAIIIQLYPYVKCECVWTFFGFRRQIFSTATIKMQFSNSANLKKKNFWVMLSSKRKRVLGDNYNFF